MHQREKFWLKSKAGDERKHLRNEYLKARSAYSKAVKGANRDFQKKICEHLK